MLALAPNKDQEAAALRPGKREAAESKETQEIFLLFIYSGIMFFI